MAYATDNPIKKIAEAAPTTASKYVLSVLIPEVEVIDPSSVDVY